MKKNRIGIFGGTFNPVHNAHVAMAEEFIRKMELDILYIIPNRIPPLKEKGAVSGEDRKAMLEIAFSKSENVRISDIELIREGTSYTRDTVAELRKLHPDDQLFLLTGDDWIGSFHKWKDYQFILDNVTLVVAFRSGKDITEDVENLVRLSGKEPKLLGNDIIQVSSTEIREGLKEEMLPEGVYEYIKKWGLYGI